jgi:serine/threonine-protein phosphatase PP1 catalytic subunit
MDPRRIRLDAILDEYLQSKRMDFQFTVSEAHWLCQMVSPIFLAEPTLLRLHAPINICGDIHGQLGDLLRSLESGGLPPFSSWLFLGDYVDRGPKSVEVICLLFALKVRYPNHVYMIRGNHESIEMTAVFGFAQECRAKLSVQQWQQFCQVFDTMPLAAVVSSSLFCVHGGISPELRNLAQIEQIRRPLQIPVKGLVTDLLWSDPQNSVVLYGPNDRGSTITWGLQAARVFLKRNRLDRIVRGHQVAMGGYDFPFSPDESVITMFTASNYAIESPNRAAFLIVKPKIDLEFRVLPPFVEPVVVKQRASSTMERRPTEVAQKPKLTTHLSMGNLRLPRTAVSTKRPGTRLARQSDL